MTESFSRRTVVRRPNRLTFTDKGDGHDTAAWYDGQRLTIVSNPDKVWVRGPMPPTLDEAMDFVSAEDAVQIPHGRTCSTATLDQALMTADTTGGWVNVEKVGERTRDHLSYQQVVVESRSCLAHAGRPQAALPASDSRTGRIPGSRSTPIATST